MTSGKGRHLGRTPSIINMDENYVVVTRIFPLNMKRHFQIKLLISYFVKNNIVNLILILCPGFVVALWKKTLILGKLPIFTEENFK